MDAGIGLGGAQQIIEYQRAACRKLVIVHLHSYMRFESAQRALHEILHAVSAGHVTPQSVFPVEAAWFPTCCEYREIHQEPSLPASVVFGNQGKTSGNDRLPGITRTMHRIATRDRKSVV